MKKYDVFISYRREGGMETASRLRESLEKRGYRVFWDIESLRSGAFNTQLYRVIEHTDNFLLILPPGGLDRCENEDDWVRREIEYAHKCNKTIIPILLRGFEFPEHLPESIDFVRHQQGLAANTEYYDAFVGRLEKLMKTGHSLPRRHRLLLLAAAAVLLLALGFGLYRYLRVYPHSTKQKNLVSSVIGYMTDQMAFYDVAHKSYQKGLEKTQDYLNGKGTESATDTRFALQSLLELVRGYRARVEELPENLAKELMDSPFDVGNLRGLKSAVDATLLSYEDSLKYVMDEVIRDERRHSKNVLAWIGILREIADLDAEMMFYQMNETLLPVTSEEALATLKNESLPLLTSIYSKGLYMVRDADTLAGREKAVYARYDELGMAMVECVAGEQSLADAYLLDYAAALVKASKETGLLDTTELEKRLEHIDEMKREIAEKKERLIELDRQLEEKRAEAWEKYKPLADDDAWLLWGKGKYFLTIGMPQAAEECFTLFIEKAEDDAMRLGGLNARRFAAQYARHGVKGGVMIFGYEENQPKQAVEIGDIVFEVDGQPTVNFAEYDRAIGNGDTHAVRILRFSDAGYETVESTIDAAHGHLLMVGLTNDS